MKFLLLENFAVLGYGNFAAFQFRVFALNHTLGTLSERDEKKSQVLISQINTIREIRENEVHAKISCFTVITCDGTWHRNRIRSRRLTTIFSP